jgi:cell division protein FtsQ
LRIFSERIKISNMKLLVKILLIVLWTAIAAGVVVMMSFANATHEVKMCRGITCRIDYGGTQPLMSGNDLIAEINRKFGKPQTKAIGDINVAGIASFVRNNPYLENTDVLLTIEGEILIKADQCVPVIRYYSSDGQQHYIDRNGRIMPVNPIYPFKALIASGQIESPLKDGKNIFSVPDSNQVLRGRLKSLYDLHQMAGLILSDSTLNALIEQVYITTKGKIQLVTKAGSHIVYLGDTTDAAEKLENLKYFYKYGLVKTGWNKYGKLNLEYKNQIVCTK